MNKTTWALGLVMLLFAVVVFGAVTVATPTAEGSNTKNGVLIGPPLPSGYSVPDSR